MSYFYRNTLGARIRRRLSSIRHSFYVDVNPDHRATVLLAGSGRSGTTWLADVINYDNAFRYIGEPFTREHVKLVRHFARLQYIRPDDDGEEFFDAVCAVLEGRIRSPWADNSNRRIVARKRLIKDDRCTLMLAWIIRRFAGMPVIYIHRHPFAVAYSRCRAHWRIRPRDVYLSQPALMADHLEPFRELITASRPEFDAHVVDWCIENYVPQRQLADRDVCHVDYDAILADRERELRRVFDYLGRPFDARAVVLSKRLSSTTFLGKDGDRRKAERDSRSWREAMSAAELRGATEIIKRFELDHLCTGEPVEPTAAPALG